MNILPLSAYPRPAFDSGSGMHGTANADFPLGSDYRSIIDQLVNHRFSWLKILSRENGNAEGIIDYALEKGMGIIVRMYRERPNPYPLNQEQKNTLSRWSTKYQDKPVYIQTNNEPDLDEEWEGNKKPSGWLTIVADNAIKDADFIQSLGLIPVLPPAATGSPDFYNYKLIPKILAIGGSRIFNGRKIVFGVHDYSANHPVGGIPYQDKPYPYDAVNQLGRALEPGEFQAFGDVWEAWGTDNPEVINQDRARNRNEGQTLDDYGAAMSCLSYLQQYNINIKDILPAPIPVMALEGGERVGMRFDGRYPRTSTETRSRAMQKALERLWNPSEPYSYPDWYLCSNPWLLDGSGSQWPLDGFFSNGQLKAEYHLLFAWHKANAKNRLSSNNGVSPMPPTPNNAETEFINFIPEYRSVVSVIPANVQEGADYWFLKSIELWNEQRSQGLHHIYFQEPHDNSLHGLINGQYIVPLEKPANEPAGNFPMSGYGATYDARLVDIIPSDTVTGMQMIGNRHVSFVLNYEKRRKETNSAMVGYKNAIKEPAHTSNYDKRPNGVKIDSIIVHATAGSLNATISWFANPASGVSAHYTIAKNGDIYQHVSETERAWHAGESNYSGRSGFNNFSIGIELENANDGRDLYPLEQQDALVRLCRDIMTRYAIVREWFLAHSDIAPGRKTDPKGLDMAQIKSRIFGAIVIPPPSLPHIPKQQMIEEAQKAQAIRLNPDAALQKAILKAGLAVTSPEFSVGNFVCQRAESLATGKRYVYYCAIGDYGNVYQFEY